MNKKVGFSKFTVGKNEYTSANEWYETEWAKNGKKYALIMTDDTYNMKWLVPIDSDKLNLDKMEFEIEKADKLEEAIELIKQAKKDYESGKETHKYFITESGDYVQNNETGNFNAINVFSFGYVVYGNLVTNGQVDSRYNTDEELAKEVFYYLYNGCTVTEKAPGQNDDKFRIRHDMFRLGF